MNLAEFFWFDIMLSIYNIIYKFSPLIHNKIMLIDKLDACLRMPDVICVSSNSHWKDDSKVQHIVKLKMSSLELIYDRLAMIGGLNRIFIFTICNKMNYNPFLKFITLNLAICNLFPIQNTGYCAAYQRWRFDGFIFWEQCMKRL